MSAGNPSRRTRVDLGDLPRPDTHDYVFADYRQVPPAELDKARERARQRAEQHR